MVKFFEFAQKFRDFFPCCCIDDLNGVGEILRALIKSFFDSKKSNALLPFVFLKCQQLTGQNFRCVLDRNPRLPHRSTSSLSCCHGLEFDMIFTHDAGFEVFSRNF